MNILNKKHGLSYIVPVYNEEETIINTLKRLQDTLRMLKMPWEIIVINDGSIDRTFELISDIKDVKVVRHPINIGYGNAVKSGIEVARYDWIGIVDADGSYPIESIPMFIKEMEKGFDMVVGLRKNVYKLDNFFKSIVRWIFKLIIKSLFGANIQDPNSGFRIFERNIIVKLMPFLCGTFSFTTSLTILSAGMNYFIKYIPIQYLPRAGKSKVRSITDSISTIQYIIQGLTFFNPMKFFFLLSIFVIIFVCIPAMFLALYNMHTLSLYYIGFGITVTLLIGMGVLGDIVRISANKRIDDTK